LEHRTQIHLSRIIRQILLNQTNYSSTFKDLCDLVEFGLSAPTNLTFLRVYWSFNSIKTGGFL